MREKGSAKYLYNTKNGLEINATLTPHPYLHSTPDGWVIDGTSRFNKGGGGQGLDAVSKGIIIVGAAMIALRPGGSGYDNPFSENIFTPDSIVTTGINSPIKDPRKSPDHYDGSIFNISNKENTTVLTGESFFNNEPAPMSKTFALSSGAQVILLDGQEGYSYTVVNKGVYTSDEVLELTERRNDTKTLITITDIREKGVELYPRSAILSRADNVEEAKELYASGRNLYWVVVATGK